mgnify:FL=1
MTIALNETEIRRIADLPEVREAARSAEELTALWPLGSALQMDNDAKYTEDLQVRFTLAFARVLTGMGVTPADAEFVYEGADAIPGRPQAIVDALLAADEAYEVMEDYARDRETDLVAEAAQALGAGWGNDTVLAVNDAIASATSYAAQVANAPMAERFAAALAVCDALLGVVSAGVGDAHEAAVRSLPVLLYVNEWREECAVPRICLTDEQILGLAEARWNASDTMGATVGFIAPLAAAEWRRHRENVLWDPDEAKQRAKAEDEERNKRELAAKFADK